VTSSRAAREAISAKQKDRPKAAVSLSPDRAAAHQGNREERAANGGSGPLLFCYS
jgi:hypothetical protein